MNDGYNIQHFYMKEDVPPMTIASPEISIGLFSKEYDKRYSCWKHGTIKHRETIINTIDNVGFVLLTTGTYRIRYRIGVRSNQSVYLDGNARNG